MLSNYKSFTENLLGNFAKKLTWVNPNILTVLGLLPQLLFVYFMYEFSYWWALAMLILSPIDMLDGLIARHTNRVTKFGGFLDSTIDRVGDFLLIIGLYVGFAISFPAFLLLMLLSFLISYARARAELASGATKIYNQGFIERPERIILIGLIILAGVFWPYEVISYYTLPEIIAWTLIILSAITFLQRVKAAYVTLDE